ncbi:hypothetical protein E1I18_03600 [Mycoplasmopsis mucosicanis]|uniref:Lipoprotein n=1 Tax=Mycoplasmopsis mucosicanis TaxID=458208 RepID=A0A507SMK0_9BACT|nr:hypothetical protein [Mycoplasmopsis mucosicanis]TQC51254.1 hypothetical protein E1I18_03600 [Mycoplasmopsis mucosicanis]
MKRYKRSKIRLYLFTLPALTCYVFLSATAVSCAKEELNVTKLNHPELKFEKEYEFKNLSPEFKINNVKLNSFRDLNFR